MLTTDFTGTYDYEKEEAAEAANYILGEYDSGFIYPHELPVRIEKELQHWSRILETNSFSEFKEHFLLVLSEGCGYEHILP